jgi:hypothetical protein
MRDKTISENLALYELARNRPLRRGRRGPPWVGADDTWRGWFRSLRWRWKLRRGAIMTERNQWTKKDHYYVIKL